MGLFTTLTNAAPTKSSLDLPTVVQLYGQEAITFDASKTAPLPYYATLSYSAVAMAQEQVVGATPLNKKKQQPVPDPVPELGVWNVRIHNDAPNLLSNVPAKCRTFVLTVDLGQPHQVAPNMTMLQHALIRHLKERNVSASDDALPLQTTTTSLYDLQVAQFGVAPKGDAESSAVVEEPDVKERDVHICLTILAKLSKTKDAAPDHYRDQQVQALLTYHLYKFACQLKASLIFVNGEDESVDAESENSNRMNTIVPISTPLQVAAILKDLAQGIVAAKPPALTLASPAGSSAAEEKHDDDKDGGSTTLQQVEAASHELSIFAPDNVDVIDSVLLRNASFPGQWDATTTSLLKILPPPLESSSSNNAAAFPKPNPSVGDQGWLKELHDSVAARGEKTPLKAAKQQEAKDDKDVSSFFKKLIMLKRLFLLLLLSWTRPSLGRQSRELQFDSLFDLTAFNFTAENYNLYFVGLIQNVSFLSVNRFLAEDTLDTCRQNLQSSNENNDYELSPDEYSTFVELESDGQISVPFADMRLILIATFYGVACNQCYGTTQSDNCCVGNSAVINIQRSNAERYAETTRFLCATVQQAIDDTLGLSTEEPTAATQEPTEAPEPTPTVTTKEPSAPSKPSASTSKPSAAAPTKPSSPTALVPSPTTIKPSLAAPTKPSSPSKPSAPTSKPAAAAPSAATSEPAAAPKPTAAPQASSATQEPSLAPQASPTTQKPTSGPKPSTPAPTPSSNVTTTKPTAGPKPSSAAPQPTSSVTTTKPTAAPTKKPSTATPTIAPTRQATAAPTGLPTKTPTKPTPTPTKNVTSAPSQTPAKKPTVAPTSNITQNVSCVTFFYSIQNSAGFTANDILTENGNTLKTGLEVATFQTLKSILNGTSTSNATNAAAITFRRRRTTAAEEIQAATAAIQHFYTMGATHAMDIAISNYFALNDADRLLDEFLYGLYTPVRNTNNSKRRRQRQLSETSAQQTNRKLAYATAALPPNITDVIADPFCPQPDQATLECAIVVTDACVVLEQGDDEAAVQQEILDGFQQALNNGEFFAKVPPENLIT
ncbi:hypothetical protein MPSEU_000224900 [Mayamaea pseudoterrestris]|nr:hypothetical protein MPSEU_000224900 [Mayamaea pseudoterrestris]